ncbi:hypothetical protein RI103_14055 [Paraburkholderia sp. FT54]|uniref:hypothetical protein n=1 Tax=Paraburkholderia sp. FT54 TaxID=3074437 RepID=UPI0028772DC1|nr:hypothetical protein [Paraburkholderia sp. FT54]WNC88822.1 hypothetical protein RI103_14055 [Paraburkholderia sp. FT54]
MMDDGPEFMRIRNAALADISRASRALATIGRILHNSIGDDCDGEICSSISNYDNQNLAGAVECLSDLIYWHIENESFDAGQVENPKRETRNV